jgi:predicted nucleotidyltransferase component of viral defense system
VADHTGGAIDETHRRIIAVIQPVLKQYGFGLAGGNALRVHGLSSRPTRDINMFTAQEGVIAQAVPQVEAALREAGFEVRARAQTGLVRDGAEHVARWVVTAAGRRVLLELRLHDMMSQPIVVSNIGSVLDVEDVLAGKTLALVDRADARDFVDVFEAIRRGWSPEQLIALAWRLNAVDYDVEYFTEVLSNLADLDDFAFSQYGLSGGKLKDLRDTFENLWPSRQR